MKGHQIQDLLRMPKDEPGRQSLEAVHRGDADGEGKRKGRTFDRIYRINKLEGNGAYRGRLF
jgi:hypothetical protein